MLNNLQPTVICRSTGAKVDTKGRVIYMVPMVISRPGKYFGMLQWGQTSASNVDSKVKADLLSQLELN